MKQYTKDQLLKEISLLKAKNTELSKADKKRELAEAALLQRENYLYALNQSKEILLTSRQEHAFQQFVDILGKVANASRTYIFINHTGNKGEALMSQKAEYCSVGIKPEIDNPDLQNLSYNEFFNRWNNTLSQGEIIFGKIDDFPVDEKEFLEVQDIKAILVIPIITDNKFIGFIGFDNCTSKREWDEAEQNFLRLAANDLAQYIERNKIQDQLKAENIRFQTTMDALDAIVYVADMQTYELLYLNEFAKKTTGYNIGSKCYTALQRGYTEPCNFCTNHLLLDAKGNPKETHVWEFQNTITNKWYQLRDKAILWPDGRIVRLEIATDITDFKEAKEAKIQSEEKYRKIVEQAPIGIITFDINGNPLNMNQHLLDILGSPSAEATKNINIIKTPNLITSGFTEDFIKCIETGKIITNESYYTSIWSKDSYIKYILNPIFDINNSITSIQAIFEDISKRKKAEDALRKSEDNLRTIFNNMVDVYYKLDRYGKILAVSPSAVNLYKYDSVDEIIGKYVTDFVHNLEENELLVKELHTKGFVKNYPIIHKRKDGVLLHIEANSTAFFDDDGKITENIGVLRDVTHRRKTEKEMMKLLTAVEQSANTIVITDIRGNIEYINPKFTDLTGYTAEEVLGQNPRVLNSGNQPKEYYTHMWQTISAGKTWKGEFNNKAKNGDLFWENVTISPIKNNKGEIINYLAVKEDITEQKRIEKALDDSEIKFQETVDMLPLMIYESDLQGDLTFINKQVFQSLGYSQNDFTSGINSLKTLIPEDRKRAMENAQKRIRGEKVLNNEYTITRKDGSLFPVLIYTSPIFKDNEVTGTRGVIIDITENKKAEMELELSNRITQQERNMFIAGPVIAFKWKNTEGWPVEYVSANIIDVLGYSSKELTAGEIIYSDLIVAEDIDRVSNEVSTFSVDGVNSFTHEPYRIKRKDGSTIWVVDYTTILRDKKGNITHYLGYILDITESKIAEQKIINAISDIEKSETRYKLLLTNTLDVIWTVDINLNMTYVNEAVFSFLGYSQEEFLKLSIDQFMTQESLLKIDTLVKKIVANSNPNIVETYKVELQQIKKDGEVIDVDLSAGAIFDSNGNITGFQGRSIDITKRKIAENKLKAALAKAEESDRLKTAFLQNISHEIRTPMNGIQGFISLLKTSEVSVSEQQEYIDIIEISSNRMLNTINDLMDISKLETGQMRLSLSTININDELENLFKFFKPEVENKGMKLNYTTSLPAVDVNIRTDHDKLYAILTNLIKNSIKYSREGSIDFGYEKKGDNLEFYVKDTGIGIPKNRQQAIFERFIQADIADVKVWEGSGLGLSISKAYIEMLNGSIWVESEEGAGSQFYFTIPYNLDKNEETNKSTKTPTTDYKKQKSKLKILIAEDEAIADKFLNIILKEISCESLHAKNGAEAVNICRENQDIDIVLMDIKMPVMSGYEATKQIRKFNKEIIIIAQTAYALEGDREKAIAAGCDEYISKPIDKDELMEMINKLVSG